MVNWLKIILGFCFCCITAQSWCQNEYITISEYPKANISKTMNGDCALMLLSKHSDLAVNVVNVKSKFKVSIEGKTPEGLYMYLVRIDGSETRTPKIEISRRGSVYKAEMTKTVNPDYIFGFKVDEVPNPIRIDDQTTSNDARLNPKEAEVEFTTSISNLKIECDPELDAKIFAEKNKADNSITIYRVVIPVSVLDEKRKKVEEINEQLAALDKKINDSPDEADEEDWSQLDMLEEMLEMSISRFNTISNILIYADGTNHLSIDISELGPRSKKSYAVLPLVVEKNIFVTQCSAFMNEGARLFDKRDYKAAKVAYDNALSSKDLVVDMKWVIEENINKCDSCLMYEDLYKRAIARFTKLKKENTVATQAEVANYLIAASEFMKKLNEFNYCDTYQSRIEALDKYISDIPLKVKFTIVEWKTLNEGDFIKDVEIWAYNGDYVVTSNTFSSDRKFKRFLNKESSNFEQLGVSDSNGIAEIDFDRKKMPKGLIFRPKDDSKTKIKYQDFSSLIKDATGTFMMKQIRLKMFTK